MIILLDVDGVLLDFVTPFLEPFGAEPSQLNWKRLDELVPWSEACRRADAPGFHDKMQWYDGARDFVESLRRIPGAALIALTAPWDGSKTWIDERVKKLKPAGFRRDDVIFCPQRLKQFVRGDVLIEDTLSTAINWGKAGPGTPIVIPRHWNTGALALPAKGTNVVYAGDKSTFNVYDRALSIIDQAGMF